MNIYHYIWRVKMFFVRLVGMQCRNCDGAKWVCENHQNRPWEGMSNHLDACHCGAGAPCPECKPFG